MSTVGTTAGTTVSVKAGAPATYDAAGYGALAYTVVGELTDAGGTDAKNNIVASRVLAYAGNQKFYAGFDNGKLSLQMRTDTDDAGQVIVKAAFVAGSKLAIKISLPNGDVSYCYALVESFNPSYGDAEKIISSTATFDIDSPQGTRYVDVPAA